MKSRYLSALTILMFCLPLTDLVAKPPSTEQRVTILESKIAELQALVDILQEELEDDSSLLEGVSRLEDPNTGYDTLRFSGMNVQIVNDEGVTYSANGTGNLIIGYNEPRDETSAEPPGCPSNTDPSCNRRNGSHNLVIGYQQNYGDATGGLVAGFQNEISGNYTSVSGGRNNLATGYFTSISGGINNAATLTAASVSGGSNNTASGEYSSVSGGDSRTATGESDWVAGSLFEDN